MELDTEIFYGKFFNITYTDVRKLGRWGLCGVGVGMCGIIGGVGKGSISIWDTADWRRIRRNMKEGNTNERVNGGCEMITAARENEESSSETGKQILPQTATSFPPPGLSLPSATHSPSAATKEAIHILLGTCTFLSSTSCLC